jgi:hypothetical protein
LGDIVCLSQPWQGIAAVVPKQQGSPRRAKEGVIDDVDWFENDSKDKPITERPAVRKNGNGRYVYSIGVGILQRLVWGNVMKITNGNRNAAASAQIGFEIDVYGHLTST